MYTASVLHVSPAFTLGSAGIMKQRRSKFDVFSLLQWLNDWCFDLWHLLLWVVVQRFAVVDCDMDWVNRGWTMTLTQTQKPKAQSSLSSYCTLRATSYSRLFYSNTCSRGTWFKGLYAYKSSLNCRDQHVNMNPHSSWYFQLFPGMFYPNHRMCAQVVHICIRDLCLPSVASV